MLTRQLMWEVPPIEFIMNDTAAQLSEVEERLKVADMGPDFEPSTLEHFLKAQPTQTVTTNALSSKSDMKNLSAFPGPGGSTELVASMTMDNKQPEAWNTSSEEPSKSGTAEVSASYDNKNTIYRNAISSVTESGTYDSITKDQQCSQRSSKHSEADSSSASSEFRSDVFGLDHERLWQQVLLAKRKSENRSYRPSDELIAEFSATSVDGTAKNKVTRDMAARSKMWKSRKSERRNRDDLLSCHYHKNEDDYRNNEEELED